MSSGTCEVSIGGYDGDPASFFVATERRARKPHTCFECHADIRIGERYELTVGKWDGRFETYKFCLACKEIGNEFADGAFSYGSVWEEMRTNWDEGTNVQACLNRLSSVAAKTKLAAQWRKWKGIE